mmetsp:Transcript_29945/g.53142  ORF Transcript_29945/g.53142 Transcript_29945/m.53142 type:complete len:243 (-) Transcript_29945:33-761(-)
MLKVNQTEVHIQKGDICNSNTDCIVNAANQSLQLGGGVAGAIRERGGSSIQQECNAWIKKHGSVPTGECAVTGPGRINCRYIIHAVGPVYHDGNSGEAEQLQSVLLNVYRWCDSEDIKAESVAIPAISSGIFGFPKAKVAKIFFATTREYLESNETSLKRILFRNFDDETCSIFRAELARLQGVTEDEITPELDEEPIVAKKSAKKRRSSSSSKPEDEPKAKPTEQSRSNKETTSNCCCLLM